MPEKIKYWWSEDRKWFCILVDDGNAKATASLNVSEAGDLGAEAFAQPVCETPEIRPPATQTPQPANLPNWEDVAVAICCGKHCDANNQGPDNEMSPDRYCKQHGCESEEVYKSATAVVEMLRAAGACG